MSIRLFLSHSSKDADLSEALVKLFQYCLKLRNDEIRCTSIVPYKLPSGAKTDAVLQKELRECHLVIGLLTQESKDSYYVLAELGARWGLDKHFMILRSSNFSFTQFSGPLGNLSISSIDTKTELLAIANQATKFFYKKKFSKTISFNKLVKTVISENSKLNVPLLDIHSAKWGSGSVFIDITSRVRTLIKDSRICTFVGIDLAAQDPTPNTKKKLKLIYSIKGHRVSKSWNEGDVLSIP